MKLDDMAYIHGLLFAVPEGLPSLSADFQSSATPARRFDRANHADH